MDSARVVREARGRAGLTQRELAQAINIHQPAIARIETGDVVPRVDTLARILAACGAVLATDRRLPEDRQWVQLRAQIRALLRATPRQRLQGVPRKPGTRFRPLELVRVLAGRHVRFVLIGEAAARAHGAPVNPGVLEVAAEPDRLNAERLFRAYEALSKPSRRGRQLPASLGDIRGRGQLRTPVGTIVCWWPKDEAYRRLAGAATEMALATRPVLVASIDDVIDRWPRGGEELDLLAIVREEMDRLAIRSYPR